jgi:perosamine synthetase
LRVENSAMSDVKLPIPVAGPWITQKEIDYVTDAATNSWYSNAIVYQTRFEQAFAAYIGVKHAVALPSCTSGIHLALAALGVGPGDEVIVPDITWIASAAPISYVGATPRFADIERDTWCMSPESFESLITERTKAVIPVDLYGNIAKNDRISAIAERHGVVVLEDAAESIGAERGGRRAGSYGRAGFFSFHGTKTLTTGEGGMLVSDDEAFVSRVNVLRDHGRPPRDRQFDNAEVAFKYKMSSLQAALGLAQLERIDELIERKREAFAWYAEELDGIDGVTLNCEEPGTKSVFWMVTVILDPRFGIDKDALQDRLKERKIDTRPFFRPLSSLRAYAHLPEAAEARRRNEVTYAIAPYGLNLPSSLSLERDQVAYVAKALREILNT